MQIILDSFAMGFELDLYIPTEYTVIYCYLQFLYTEAVGNEVADWLEDLTISPSTPNTFRKDLNKYYNILSQMCSSSFALSALVGKSAIKRVQPYFKFGKYYQNRFQYLGMLSSPILLQPSQYLQMEQQFSTQSFLKLKSTCEDLFKTVKIEIMRFNPQYVFMKRVFDN